LGLNYDASLAWARKAGKARVTKVLVVEDDLELANMVTEWLTLDGHEIELVHDGIKAMDRLRGQRFDLVVLDWALPGLTGIEILKELRAQKDPVTILMLTGRDADRDKETGLDTGADDYLTKPFDGRELKARVRALLRRPAVLASEPLRCGDIVLDPTTFAVTKGAARIELVRREFNLLEFLMRNPARVVGATELLSAVWSDDTAASEKAVVTCVKRIRQKLDTGGQPSIILTVHGVGYKLNNEHNSTRA
jgi:DNA-binding response OmpR family regulator